MITRLIIMRYRVRGSSGACESEVLAVIASCLECLVAILLNRILIDCWKHFSGASGWVHRKRVSSHQLIRIESDVHESSGGFEWASGFCERRRVLRARISDDSALRGLRLQRVSWAAIRVERFYLLITLRKFCKVKYLYKFPSRCTSSMCLLIDNFVEFHLK